MSIETKAELVGVSQRIQKAIEDQIAALASGVAGCVEKAGKYKSETPYDSTCTTERRDAVQMVEATATLLQSIAKLRGEFRHNYRVTRVSEGEKILGAPNGSKPWNGDEAQLLSGEEHDALSEEEQIDYDRWTKGLAPKYGGWRKPDLKSVRAAAAAPRNREPDDLEAEIDAVGASLKFRGSNDAG